MKITRTSFIIFTLLFYPIFLSGQGMTFKKSIIKNIDDAKINFTYSQHNQFVKEFNRQKAASSARQELSTEEVIHDYNGTKTSIRRSGQNSELVRYVNNEITSKRFLNREEIAYPIDSNGGLMIGSHSEGGITNSFTFLSSSLSELDVYTPYEFGTSDFHFGYSNNLTCIYAVNKVPPEKYKLTLLDHSGKVIASREFESKSFGAVDIKMNDNSTFILFNNYSKSDSKIAAFDSSLNQLWEWQSLEGVSGYSIESDFSSKSLIAVSQKRVYCIDIGSGKNKWDLSTDELYGEVVSLKSFSSAYILNGTHIALVICELREGHFDKTKLIVVDVRNGTKVYEDALGTFSIWPKIIGGKDGFVISTDMNFYLYRI